MDNLTSAKDWQRFAEMDLMSAEYLFKMSPVTVEIICYHFQQSAEIYLKEYSIAWDESTKDSCLNQLLKLCVNISDRFLDIADHCSGLTAYGVPPKYPMKLIQEERDMQDAIISAKAIRDFIFNIAPQMGQED